GAALRLQREADPIDVDRAAVRVVGDAAGGRREAAVRPDGRVGLQVLGAGRRGQLHTELGRLGLVGHEVVDVAVERAGDRAEQRQAHGLRAYLALRRTAVARELVLRTARRVVRVAEQA